MPMRLSRAVYDFESFLAVQRNLSPGTRQAYVADVEQFVAYLAEVRKSSPRLDQITPDDVRGYLEYVHEKKHLGPARMSRIIVSLRQFFEFCVERGHIETSPAATIHTPKKDKKLPVFLISPELRRLFEAPDRADAQGRRDFAILVTLAFSGIRLKELVGLDLDDIDFSTGQIKVFGKGSKERFVPLNSFLTDSLKGYLKDRRASPEPAVFLNRFGKRLGGRSVEKIVKRYGLQAGIFKKHISPHKLRHTFATLLHMKDVDILEIQQLLGHSSITSTQIYTHTHPGKLKSAVEKLTDI